jgi:hypothetical protein
MAVALEDLRLHERALLLALDDDRGTIHTGAYYSYAIAGGVLAELILEERIALEHRRRGERRVVVTRATQVGDPIIDDILERIRTAKKEATLETWVSRVAQIKELRHRVAERLARKGVLKAEEDTVLLLFKRRVYPELDPGPERELVASLRDAILSDDDIADPRVAILATLAWHAELLRPVLDSKEQKGRKERIEALGRGDAVADATRSAVEAVQAAVVAATTAAIVITTTSS